MLRHLARHGRTPLASLPARSILVARELSPLDLLEIDCANLAGIVTEHGGETGHAAILARARDPGDHGRIRRVSWRPARSCWVDGSRGTVWADPAAEEAQRFSGRARDYMRGLAAAIAALLIGLGIRELSMSPAASPRVRQRIRALDSRDVEALATAALACRGAHEVRMAVYSWPWSAATRQGFGPRASAAERPE